MNAKLQLDRSKKLLCAIAQRIAVDKNIVMYILKSYKKGF
jgi:hypothetical protein